MTHRTFISLILAVSLAVTGMTAAPARADNDAAKVIAGVAALAIIGAVIAEDRKDRKRKRRAAASRNHVQHYNYGQRRYNNHDHRYHDHGYKKSRKRYSPMPSRCRVDGFVRGNPVYGYGRSCLRNTYASYNALPHNCAVNARGYRGERRVIYRGQCLRNHGYVTPDHR